MFYLTVVLIYFTFEGVVATSTQKLTLFGHVIYCCCNNVNFPLVGSIKFFTVLIYHNNNNEISSRKSVFMNFPVKIFCCITTQTASSNNLLHIPCQYSFQHVQIAEITATLTPHLSIYRYLGCTKWPSCLSSKQKRWKWGQLCVAVSIRQ